MAWLVMVSLSATLTEGCGNDPLPQAQRPTIDEAIRSGRGSLTRIQGTDGSAAFGELIEATPDGLRLLTGNGVTTVPRGRVSWARVLVYRTTENAFAVWTVLGTLSTVSHGAFLFISAPAWAIDGMVATFMEAKRGEVRYPEAAAWSDLWPYARFPQGVPIGVTDDQLLHGRVWPTVGPAAAAPPIP